MLVRVSQSVLAQFQIDPNFLRPPDHYSDCLNVPDYNGPQFLNNQSTFKHAESNASIILNWNEFWGYYSEGIKLLREYNSTVSIVSREDPSVDYSIPNDIVAALQAFYNQFDAYNKAYVARSKPFLAQSTLPNRNELQWNELKHTLDHFYKIGDSIATNLLWLQQSLKSRPPSAQFLKHLSSVFEVATNLQENFLDALKNCNFFVNLEPSV